MIADAAVTRGPSPMATANGPHLRTRGHARAVAAVLRMIVGRPPHALLIGGPPGVGKTTLALDLAAGLLCGDPDPAARPCRACRACRLVDRGIHPDVHRLSPAGAGDQIRIGSREAPEDGTVRRLTLDLALMSVEGGARVAIVERADRMGDDAQTALLKTLEEPPAGVTIVLCADDEDRLMPTVRSRCARLRLGPVGLRDVEDLLVGDGLAEPPVAARLARLSGGRPGLARTLARAPDAIAARDEIARLLLDLLSAGPADRLTAARDLVRSAGLMNAALATAGETASIDSFGSTPGATGNGRGRGRAGGARAGAGRSPGSRPAAAGGPVDDAGSVDDEADGTEGGDDASAAVAGSASAAERRRLTGIIVGLWRDLARDLLVVRLGEEREVRDPALLDDLRAASAALAPAGDASGAETLTTFLSGLDASGELLEANVRPELVLDSLLLAWPTAPVAGSEG